MFHSELVIMQLGLMSFSDHPYLGGVILCLSTPCVFSYKASSSAMEFFEQAIVLVPSRIMPQIRMEVFLKVFIELKF